MHTLSHTYSKKCDKSKPKMTSLKITKKHKIHIICKKKKPNTGLGWIVFKRSVG